MLDAAISARELDLSRQEAGKDYSIGDLAAEITFVTGFSAPASSGGKIAPQFAETVQKELQDAKAGRFLIYITENTCVPEIERVCDFVLRGAGIVSETHAGACAALLSGASTSVHRVFDENCERLDRVKTIFDVMQQDRKIALLSLNNSAPDIMFRWRLLDYYSLRTGELIYQNVKALIKEDIMDGIVCFMGKETLEEALTRFPEAAALADEYWKDRNRVLVHVSSSEQGLFTVHGFQVRRGKKGE